MAWASAIAEYGRDRAEVIVDTATLSWDVIPRTTSETAGAGAVRSAVGHPVAL
jgi:hypothetical protein